MIAFDVGRQRFQLRAAAVCLHDGHVLLHRACGDEFWALPGGRVDMHEDAASALRREMMEELGVAVECGPLLFVAENFFEIAERPHHEVGLYFPATFAADAPVLDKQCVHRGSEGGRPLEFRWFDQRSLARSDLRPAFLRRALAGPALRFEHIVHRDGTRADGDATQRERA